MTQFKQVKNFEERQEVINNDVRKTINNQATKLEEMDSNLIDQRKHLLKLQEAVIALQKKNPSFTFPAYQPGNPIIEIDKELPSITPLNEYTTEELDNNFKNVNDNFKLMDEWQTKAEERFNLMHAELAKRPLDSDIRNLEAKIETNKMLADEQALSTNRIVAQQQKQLFNLAKDISFYRTLFYIMAILSFIEIILRVLTIL
jgi:hypothetical protein